MSSRIAQSRSPHLDVTTRDLQPEAGGVERKRNRFDLVGCGDHPIEQRLRGATQHRAHGLSDLGEQHTDAMAHTLGVVPQTLAVEIGTREVLFPEERLDHGREQPLHGPWGVARSVGDREPDQPAAHHLIVVLDGGMIHRHAGVCAHERVHVTRTIVGIRRAGECPCFVEMRLPFGEAPASQAE